MILLIIYIIVILFFYFLYKKCQNNKIVYFKVLLYTSLFPFICNLFFSVLAAIFGFEIFDIEKVYGLKAFCTCFSIYCIYLCPIFIPAFIAIIVAIIIITYLKSKFNHNLLIIYS